MVLQRPGGRSGPFVAGLMVLLYVTAAASMVLLWSYSSRLFGTEGLFPGPKTTFTAFLELASEGQLAGDILASLGRIGLGFAVGSGLGFAVGMTAGYFEVVRDILFPYIHFLRFISAIAWLPMTILWLGTGEMSKIALIGYTTTFIVMVNTMAGVAVVPMNRLRAAACFGANGWQVFRRVIVPSALGHFFVGMRLAMGNSFATVTTAEMLAAKSGLGFLIWTSRAWLAVDHIFVGLLCLGVLGILADRALFVVTDIVFRRYRLGV